jgi:hypothetical protein
MCAFNGTQCSIEYEHERRITIDGYQKNLAAFATFAPNYSRNAIA